MRMGEEEGGRRCGWDPQCPQRAHCVEGVSAVGLLRTRLDNEGSAFSRESTGVALI